MTEYVCPKCKVVLDFCLQEYECSSCSQTYPINNGIARFVDVDNYSNSFGFQWNLHQKTQLDSHTGLPISEKRIRDAAGWAALPDLTNSKILEAGSGSGRFTEILLRTGADVWSFDYSNAVDANHANHSSKKLHLSQASIFDPPFFDCSFDQVWCLGVVQHTPNPQLAIESLFSLVAPGGVLYFDVYTKSLIHLISWKYLLRPLTRNIEDQALYKFIALAVPALIPLSAFLRRWLGRFGARLVPIREYSHLGLKGDVNTNWAILDTFDMYSPKYDKPLTIEQVETLSVKLKVKEVDIKYGENGIVARFSKGFQ